MSNSTVTENGPVRRAKSVPSMIALVVATMLTIGTAIVLLQNTIHMQINVAFWNFDVAQGLALLAAAVVGALITVSVGSFLRIRRALR